MDPFAHKVSEAETEYLRGLKDQFNIQGQADITPEVMEKLQPHMLAQAYIVNLAELNEQINILRQEAVRTKKPPPANLIEASLNRMEANTLERSTCRLGLLATVCMLDQKAWVAVKEVLRSPMYDLIDVLDAAGCKFTELMDEMADRNGWLDLKEIKDVKEQLVDLDKFTPEVLKRADIELTQERLDAYFKSKDHEELAARYKIFGAQDPWTRWKLSWKAVPSYKIYSVWHEKILEMSLAIWGPSDMDEETDEGACDCCLCLAALSRDDCTCKTDEDEDKIPDSDDCACGGECKCHDPEATLSVGSLESTAVEDAIDSRVGSKDESAAKEGDGEEDAIDSCAGSKDESAAKEGDGEDPVSFFQLRPMGLARRL